MSSMRLTVLTPRAHARRMNCRPHAAGGFYNREPGAQHDAGFTWDAVLDVIELARGPQVRRLSSPS